MISSRDELSLVCGLKTDGIGGGVTFACYVFTFPERLNSTARLPLSCAVSVLCAVMAIRNLICQLIPETRREDGIGVCVKCVSAPIQI